jgi:hypothetical protein
LSTHLRYWMCSPTNCYTRCEHERNVCENDLQDVFVQSLCLSKHHGVKTDCRVIL